MLSIASFFSIAAREYEHFSLTPSTARTITTVVLAVCVGVILAALYNFYVRRVPGGIARLLLSRNATSPERALNAEELELLNKPFSLWELLRGTALRGIVCAVKSEPTEAEAAQDVADDAEAKAEESKAPEVEQNAAEEKATEAEIEQSASEESEAAAPEFKPFWDEEDVEAKDATPKKKKAPYEPLFDAETRFYIPEEKKYRAEIRFEQKGNGVSGLIFTCALASALGILLIKMIPVVLAMIDNMM